MLVSLPGNAAGAHRIFAEGERRQRRWRWEGGVVQQDDSDFNLTLERLLRSASPRSPGLVVNRSCFSALVFCLVLERGRRGIEIVIEKKSGFSGVVGTH